MNGSHIPASVSSTSHARVRVVGTGDTGVRTASAMAGRLAGLADVTCIDTDSASLRRASGAGALLIGETTFHGFGSGGDVTGAERAARERIERLVATVSGADCVIIVAGMGGGTGSGVAPVVAAAAKLAGAHVLAIVSMPFEFEGHRRETIARDALAMLKAEADAVAPLSNDRLNAICAGAATMDDALRHDRELNGDIALAVASLFSSSRAFSQLTPGHVLSVLTGHARAFVGAGESSGPAAAAEATEAALNSASAVDLEAEVIDRAILMIEAGPGLPLTQVAAAMGTAQARLGVSAEVHMGIRESRSMGDAVKVTLFAACRDRRRPIVIAERPAALRTFDARMPIPMFG